jgi:predicted Zn-dependent peptidase
MTPYNKLKRYLRSVYWWWKDRRVIELICDNPETYLVNIPADSDKIGADVFIRSGISIESQEDFGIGHLLEHYISETIVRDHQADLYSNGRINHEMMNLYVRIDKDKTKTLIEKFLNKVFHVDFSDQEMLDYEKLAIQNELNTDSHNLVRRIERLVETGRFQDECFCIKSFEDSIEPTGRLTLADLKAHYRRIFNRQNVKIFISAYSPSPAFKTYLKKILPAFALPEGMKTEYPACRYSDGKVEIVPDKTITGTYAYLTLPALLSTDNPKDKIVLRMALDLLTGREEDFSVNKKARQSGIYSINSYWVRMEKIGFIALYSYIPKDRVGKLLEIIGTSLAAVRSKPVTADYLKRETRDLGNIYRREWRSNERVNWVIDETVEHGRHETLDFYLDVLRSITPEDILAMAKKIFDPDKINLYIYGEMPAESVSEMLSLIKRFQAKK